MGSKHSCIIKETKYSEEKAILKTFEKGKLDAEFNNEAEAVRIFSKYKWFPEVYEIGDNSITYKYYGKSNGWNNSINKANILQLPAEKKNTLLENIISAIYDIHGNGYAHRDLHALNIFYSSDTLDIIIIDFELMAKYKSPIPFISSYDIIGAGLESPYDSLNNCVMKDYPHSIKNSFDIKSIGEIEKILNKIKNEEISN